MSGEVGGLLGLGMVGGCYLMASGVQRFRQYRAIKDTPTTTIQAASLGDGEIKGTATEADGFDTIQTPLTEEECLFTEYELEQRSDNKWASIAHGVYGVPFTVDDGTGKLFVNPEYSSPNASVMHEEDASFSDLLDVETLKNELSIEGTKLGSFVSGFDVDIEPSETEDERYERTTIKYDEFDKDSPTGQFLSELGLAKVIDNSDGGLLSSSKFRLTEKNYLHPEEDVYMFGNLEASDMTDTSIDDDYDMTMRNADGQSGLFFVSNQDEDELLEERRRSPYMRFMLGTLLFAASFVLTLMYFGLI